MTEPPNIVLIVVDQWRGDALGRAGHPVVQTPHLDRLAWELDLLGYRPVLSIANGSCQRLLQSIVSR